MAQKTDGWVSAGPVAKLLHVSPKTIARWTTEGYTGADGQKHKLPCVRTLGGDRRFSVAVVNELAELYEITERL